MDWGDYFTLIMSVVFVVLLIWLAYKASKWMSKRNFGPGLKGKYINIVDRVAIGQDKSILLIKACDKYLLIGVSNSSVELIKELDEFTIIEQAPAKMDFQFLLHNIGNRIKKSQGDRSGKQNKDYYSDITTDETAKRFEREGNTYE